MSTTKVSPATIDTAFNMGARARPPAVFAGFLLTGLLLHRLMPFSILPRGTSMLVGRVLAVFGLGLGVASLRAFRVARTPVDPMHPTTELVNTGPYRYTRNPIYLSLTLLYAGISFIVGAAWPLLLLPSILFVINKGMVEGEERYLEQRFGDRYRQYKEHVGRWI